MSGVQSRQIPATPSANPVETTTVTRAATGPVASGAFAGTSSIRLRATGKTVTAISMMTVPQTVGVITRRINGNRQASTR